MSGLSAAQRVFAAEAEKPPNIVVVLCDDLGYGDLGCYGHPVIQTPNLDRFATEGIRFTDCYSAAPVCSPSRAGLLTGRTPNRCGIYDWIPENSPVHLRRDETTVASALKKAGYRTCQAGKWHLNGKFNSPAQPQPGDHGFDHWFATQNNAIPSHEDPDNFVRNGKAAGPQKGYSSTLIVDEAMRWMSGLTGPDPFFVFAALHSPHEPVATAPEYIAKYPQARKRGEALYYGNVSQADHEFGRLMRFLDQRRLRDNTLVLFTSDNGPETLNRYPVAWRSHGSAGPLRSMKLSIYDGGYRVPGLMRWPGRINAGQVFREPVCGLDLLPTLCELAGAPIPAGKKIDGSSIRAAFEGRPVERKSPLHWHYFNSMEEVRSSMRRGDWKILGAGDMTWERSPGGGFKPGDMAKIKSVKLTRFELYNMKADRGELSDLASQEPERLRQMTEELVRLHEEVKAEAPEWT
jgi:arylsulfatase A